MPDDTTQRHALLRRGLMLEYVTLGWNVIGVIVLSITAVAAGSVALAAFGIDSLIEILASTMVVWQLTGSDGTSRTVPALRVIALAFAGLAIYILVQSSIVLVTANHPGHSPAGTVWLAATALVMFALARGKAYNAGIQDRVATFDLRGTERGRLGVGHVAILGAGDRRVIRPR